VAVRERIDDYFRGRMSQDEANLLYLETRKEHWFGRIFLPDPSSAVQWPSIMDFDIAPALARIDLPALLVFGEDDRWVPIDATIDVWRKSVADASKITVSRIAGSGHAMTVPVDPDDWLERGLVSPEYEQALTSWLATHLGSQSVRGCTLR
jgi:pimeloyl-ACP methyl ester carboxylesterase